MIKDPSLIRALSRCEELSDFFEDEYDLSNPEFIQALSNVRKLIVHCTKVPLSKDAVEEIHFAFSREEKACILQKMQEEGTLPVRATHNDTKINNVLLDADTKKAICVIDLDTVMPGLAAFDFGDAIRFGASTAVEDEPQLERIGLDLELYRYFARGFLESCPVFTKEDKESFAYGALSITLE